MRVVWSASAIADVVRIRRYIADFNPHAARRMGERLLAAGDSLARFPERGRPVSGEVRDLVAVWPYSIRYRVTGDVVLVLRVRHGARAPD